MDLNSDKNPQNTLWWITSLAISVVCCAIFFLILVCYLVDMRKETAISMAVENVRLEVLEQRLNRSEGDVENLRRRTTVQQIQVVPSSTPVQLPVSVLPSPETAPAPAPTAAPAPTHAQ